MGAKPNHPSKGASLKVEPIADLEAIGRIKAMFKSKYTFSICRTRIPPGIATGC